MLRIISAMGLAGILGCGPSAASGTWEARREMIGDTAIVHTLSGQVWPSGVELVEDLAIGTVEGRDELMFGEITRLTEDREGGIYVLDGQGPIIRHFDRGGAFVRNVGGPGEGPGEYKHLSMAIVVDSAGTLYMHDWGNGRIARFSRDGDALEPWPLPSDFLTTVPGTWLYSDGPARILVRASIDGRPALLVMDGGRVADTLVVPQPPGMPVLRGGPYRVDSYWGWNETGYFVVGVSNQYVVEAHTPAGVLRIKRDIPELAVHPEEAEAWRRYFEWMEGNPMYRAPEGEWLPSHMPPFRGIDVATDGRIWVRRNSHPIEIPVQEIPDGPPPVSWTQPFLYDVFDADGSFLGEIPIPDRVQPFLFGSGHIWGVRRGDFDVQYVVRLVLRGTT